MKNVFRIREVCRFSALTVLLLRCALSIASALVLVRMACAGETSATPQSSSFQIRFEDGGIASLKRANDLFETDYIATTRRLGNVLVRYRGRDGAWQDLNTRELDRSPESTYTPGAGGRSYTASYLAHDSSYGKAPSLSLENRFVVNGEQLEWTTTLRNVSKRPYEIDDWAAPLPMNTSFAANKPATQSVLKHSFISGDNSHIFWMRSNSVGPYLVMTTLPGTSLEYWDAKGPAGYQVYIHSAAAGAQAKAQGTRWRQPHTFLRLAPAGQVGDVRTYGFRFHWASNYNAVRQTFVDEGQMDVDVVPSMTVPNDLAARFALRTKQPIQAIDPEFPSQTQIQYLGRRGDRSLYQVRFRRLGENKLTLRYGRGLRTTLEFFSTEPLETLIKKRAAFIARHQVRDAAKWYNGLFTEWNLRDGVALTPDNYDGLQSWRIYEVTCDDPGLSKPAFLAAKNAEYPVQSEVSALDYYVRHFVWGGLQRTPKEKFAFGLYGIPDWKHNRTSVDKGTQGQLHLWRPYDYPHIVVLYLSLYRVARTHPHIKTVLGAQEYLRRAYGTAMAMFTVPKQLVGWDAYHTGFYNERIIPEVIAALETNGRTVEAAHLRAQWEAKVKTFVAGETDLFGSEYPFDSTGFESTHVLAKYALQPGHQMGLDPTKARSFLEKQMAANIFCRGWLEPAYYYLGSDYRAGAGNSFTLSYMSPMGGGAVLDYALDYARDPFPYLRLGYASLLSSWALMNSGNAASNYGFWYPGVQNDGGAGGGFEPAPFGATWLGQPHHRGAWYYACETDLGYCGALRALTTVLTDDPIFGRFCFGGDWKSTANGLEIVPKDGVRKRFTAVLKRGSLRLVCEDEHFASNRPITLAHNLSGLRFYLESDEAAQHTATVRLSGMPPGTYSLCRGTVRLATITSRSGAEVLLRLPVSKRTGEQPFAIAPHITSSHH